MALGNIDAPTVVELGKVRKHIAKKEHTCDLCKQPIRVGLRYSVQVIKEDGKVGNFKRHDYACWIEE